MPLARAHVELVSCTNQYQIIPCGPHARADVGLLQNLRVRNDFNIKTLKNSWCCWIGIRATDKFDMRARSGPRGLLDTNVESRGGFLMNP